MSSYRSSASLRPVLSALARGALGPGYVPEVPDRMLEGISHLASEADRKQLLATLRALDTKAGALLLTGARLPVSWMTGAEAESLLLKWKASRLSVQRRLAGAITSLATTSLYGHPGAEWERIRYQGPIGPAPTTPKRLAPLGIEQDEHLLCDVVVVGSGAGGGCVAGVLAAAGHDVIVLEKGGYRSESDFTHLEPDAVRDMYLYGMTLATSDQGVRIVAGSTLGGGTLVNYATSFRTPDFVLREWAHKTGIDAFISGEFDESLDEVSERVGVNTDSSAAGRRDVVMEEGLKKLGWHVDLMPRAVRGCTQDEACGYCGFGCRVGAKQSTMRTYLEDAAAHGARLITGANVTRVSIADGTATGVEARVGDHRLRVGARIVVVAAGALETPALLLRSKLRGRVGHYLHLHPGTAAWGYFDDDVRVWEGTTQARYSNEFRHWDGGYGPIFETIPIHPGAGSAFIPWLSMSDHRLRMEKFGNLGFCGVLPRDASCGRVRLGKEGNPRIDYRLGADDQRRIAEAVIRAAQVMEAAGATQVQSPHSHPVSYIPGPGRHEKWAEETRRLGYNKGRVTFGSWHQMGSCRMGTKPSDSAIGSDNETHEVRNLFVTDASAFPTASGVNPMLTVYAIANRAAKKIDARLS